MIERENSKLKYPVSYKGIGIRATKNQDGKIQYQTHVKVVDGDVSWFYDDIEPAIVGAIEGAWLLGYKHALEVMEKETARKLSKLRR